MLYIKNPKTNICFGIFYVLVIFNYNIASNFSAKVAFGEAPTCLSTISPPFINKIVGIFLIPYFEAMGVCCLTTKTLFLLWKDVKHGKINAEDVKRKIMTKNGELRLNEFY